MNANLIRDAPRDARAVSPSREKGNVEKLENKELKDWFYRELSVALRGPDTEAVEYFIKFLDSPRRVILEIDPTQRIGYDGAKMGKATAAWIKAQAQQAQRSQTNQG